jgi:hypothetical protein
MGIIIGLGHKARSGKDTAADYLVHQHGFKKVSFGDALKRGCAGIFGLSEEELYGDLKKVVNPYWKLTPRDILQRVGTDALRRHFMDEIWVKAAFKAIDDDPASNWVIPDVRFDNEAAAIQQLGGLVVRVDRDQDLRDVSPEASLHESETALDHFTGWDIILENHGTLQTFYDGVESIYEDAVNAVRASSGSSSLPWSTTASVESLKWVS